MDTNKMREQFEAVYLEMIEKEFGEGLVPSMQRTLGQKRHDGSYQDPTQRWMYWAWQASREAVVVEPVWPDHYDYTNSDVAGAAVLDCRTAFQKAMKAQGLKVAP
ncbi:hypothetical protein [Pseudomonas sp. REB1044]|uniref:hypothetical protein n=1 Tax=Pseudomonas sp. REB1044 TaxID=2675224 RepID=UPI00315DAD8F